MNLLNHIFFFIKLDIIYKIMLKLIILKILEFLTKHLYRLISELKIKVYIDLKQGFAATFDLLYSVN